MQLLHIYSKIPSSAYTTPWYVQCLHVTWGFREELNLVVFFIGLYRIPFLLSTTSELELEASL